MRQTEHLSQKRNFVRNVLQPTRNLCHFRFKSYGPLSDFHKSGDLDLALYPIFKKKLHIVLGPEDIICQNIRTIGPAVWSVHRERTNRQTYRQTAVTNILSENRRIRKVMKGHSESAYFAKLDNNVIPESFSCIGTFH